MDGQAQTIMPPQLVRSCGQKKTSHRLVDQLAMVQRQAARWVTGRYHNTSNVTDRLQSLDWRTREQRRVDSRHCMLYKIRNHLVAVEEEHYVQRGTGRRSHQYRQLTKPRSFILYQCICSAQSRNRYNSRIVLRKVGILTLLRKVGILTLRKTILELVLRKVGIGTVWE